VITRVKTATAEETIDVGRRLGRTLRAGAVVSLQGPLGAGKTTLAKGIAEALGIDEPLTSPTFTLISSYEGSLALNHVDLYRLGGSREIEDLGLEEVFSADAVTLVEWGEKAASLLPPAVVTVQIALDGGGRAITIEGATL
jgi:tRNA threonylcarbamoyladenosine biosynthesis protein TsaE